MNIICLDAEFADNEELLELSVFDLMGEEVYHSYYRPEKIKTWHTDIHHITPEMVAGIPTFSAKRNEVQALLDKAFAITGFAVDNDLRVLTRSGIKGLEGKRVIDVKDMYWYVRGRQKDMNPFSMPSLISCANKLGLDFGEDTAHSASADTEATLKCFNILMDEFKESEGVEMNSEDLVNLFIERIVELKARFIEEGAKGFVKLYKTKDFYKIHFGRVSEEGEKGLFLEVAVADRYKAEYELRKLLKKKELPDKRNVYRLTPELIEDIRSYRNSYDADDSAWCKKVLRNLSKFSL